MYYKADSLIPPHLPAHEHTPFHDLCSKRCRLIVSDTLLCVNTKSTIYSVHFVHGTIYGTE